MEPPQLAQFGHPCPPVNVMRLPLLLSLLAILATAAPVQADLWEHVPDVDAPVVIQGDVEATQCHPDDPACQLTCSGAYFDGGYQGAEVDPQRREAVVPGPGQEGGQIVLLGHWTICW